MSLKGLDAGLGDDAPTTHPRPGSPQGGNGDEALGSGANNGKVARRTPRTRDEFVEHAVRIRAEAAKCVSTSWMKWTPEPAKAYPRYRQAGHLAPIESVSVPLTRRCLRTDVLALQRSTSRLPKITPTRCCVTSGQLSSSWRPPDDPMIPTMNHSGLAIGMTVAFVSSGGPLERKRWRNPRGVWMRRRGGGRASHQRGEEKGRQVPPQTTCGVLCIVTKPKHQAKLLSFCVLSTLR